MARTPSRHGRSRTSLWYAARRSLPVRGRQIERLKGRQRMKVRHSYPVAVVSDLLKDDPFFDGKLPLDPHSTQLFELCKGGVALCKIINKVVVGTVDERALLTEASTPWEIYHNCRLCINSAKAIGCKVVNVGEGDIADGTPHLILGAPPRCLPGYRGELSHPHRCGCQVFLCSASRPTLHKA
eukprot:scaffold4647_cov393-Prasinococcus_capsulatus_cf.AAC.11